MRFLKRAWPVVLAVCLSGSGPASAALGDERFLALREAFAAGDRKAFVRLDEGFVGHPLQAYVEYYRLKLDLDQASPETVLAFLARHDGSLIAERLRSDWLRVQARQGNWTAFDTEYPRLVAPDDELSCHALGRRAAQGDAAALDEGMRVWERLVDAPAACTAVFDALVNAGRVKTDQVWARLRLLMEARRSGPARSAAAYLPASEAPSEKMFDDILANPRRFFDRLPVNYSAHRRGRELAMMALARMARSDALETEQLFESVAQRFSPAERSYVFGQIGWQGALQHQPKAVQWCRAAGAEHLGEEAHAWCVRAGLRVKQWRWVHEAIERMPEPLRSRPEWVYWLARAHAALGRTHEAGPLYERIAGQPNFYGLLAEEELDRPHALPARTSVDLREWQLALLAEPAIGRALALLALDLRTEGVKEWNWALRNRDDAFLLAAAELARSRDLWDRAIAAADRTATEHDFSLRYLAPFRARVEPRARELGLDPAWVYGLMRQESRFVMNARSSTGAQGLMQVMPATAQWVARKIGMNDFRPGRSTDLDTNIVLGTNYLKLVLDSLDDAPVLATAAYNAGPGRARKWRAAKPMEGAIYAETIPFSETRDYVKKVMANTLYYSLLFEGRTAGLKSRLGIIQPGTGISEDDPS